MNTSFELMYDNLHIAENTQATEQEVLEMISDKVAYYLKYDKDLLVSYLYRLDIAEVTIENALQQATEEPIDVVLATLILDRQKQRIATKQKYKVTPIKGWEF